MINRLFSTLLIALVHFYQRAISPGLHALLGPGSGCRFHPTCSAYFIEAVRVHGPLRGTMMGLYRILRCNPFCQGGNDPVPPRRTH